MKQTELLKLAEQEGFFAAVCAPEEIPVDARFRKFCADNLCGKYNANYSCPPACGTVEELHAKLLAEETVLVVQTIREIGSYENQEAVQDARKTHNAAVQRLADQLWAAGFAGFCAGYNGCTLCDPCKQTLGAPCAFPEKRMSCMSAYCVDAGELAKRCNFEFAWTPEKLHLFGLIAFHRAEQSD